MIITDSAPNFWIENSSWNQFDINNKLLRTIDQIVVSNWTVIELHIVHME